MRQKMIEIEVKIKVPDLKTTRQKLLDAGCEIVRDFYREWNALYDFQDGLTVLAGSLAVKTGRQEGLHYL